MLCTKYTYKKENVQNMFKYVSYFCHFIIPFIIPAFTLIASNNSK